MELSLGEQLLGIGRDGESEKSREGKVGQKHR